MGLFGRTVKTQDRIVLITHVGSARVSIALAIVSPSRPPRVVYHADASMPVQKNLDFKRFVSSMAGAFAEALELIERKGLPHLTTSHVSVDHAIFVYASPWYAAQTRVLTKKEGRPFLVSQAMINTLAASSVAPSASTAEAESIIEQHITAVTLNGYPAHDLSQAHHTKDLRVTVSVTAIAKRVADTLETELLRRFHVPHITHHSFALAAFTTVRDVFHAEPNFLIVDMSGEVTDVIFAKQGELLETATFPYGFSTMLRGLSKNTGHDLRTLKTLLRAYAEGTLATEKRGTLESALHTEEQAWREQFMETVKHFFHEITLPGVVFVVADQSIASIFKHFVENIHEAGLFDAHALHHVALGSHVDFPEQAIHDPFLGIDVYFGNRVVQ